MNKSSLHSGFRGAGLLTFSCLLCLLLLLGGCNRQQDSETEDTTIFKTKKQTTVPSQTGMTKEIPSSYLRASSKPGTIAEGWLDRAVTFWEKTMK